MKIDNILNSKAKFQILKALASGVELGLRQFESVTDLQIGSIQRAIPQLLEGKIIYKKKRGNRTLFALNDQSVWAQCIKDIFHRIRIEEIKHQSSNFNQRARNVLKKSDELFSLTKKRP